MSALARTLGGPAARSSWRSASTPGLLADIGAVRPLTGLAFAESQVAEMNKYGFEARLG